MGHVALPWWRRLAQARTWPESTRWNLLFLTIISTLFFHKLFLHPTQLLWGYDVVAAHSANAHIQWRSFSEWGRFPLWDPTIFCGASTVGDQMQALFNPFQFVFWLTPSPVPFGYYLWLAVTLSAWGTFLFARRSGLDACAACFSSVIFAMSWKTAAHLFAGHVLLLSSALQLPWMLLVTEKLCQDKTFGSVCLVAFTITLVAFIGHVQMTYYNLLFTLGYLGLRSLHELRTKRILAVLRPASLFSLSLALFAVGSMAWWLPIVRQTLLLSARVQFADYDFATSSSVSPRDLIRMVWPFWDLPELNIHNWNQGFFWETAAYPGIMAVVLGPIAALSFRRTKGVGIWLALGGTAFLLAFGKYSPVYWLAHSLVPGFGLFRCPGRLLFYATFALAMLVGRWLSQKQDSQPPKFLTGYLLLWSFAVTVVLAVSDTVFLGSNRPWIPVFILIAATLAAFLWVRQRISFHGFRRVLLALLIGDLYMLWQPLILTLEPHRPFRTDPIARFLAERRVSEEFRVLDLTSLTSQHVAERHGLELVTGTHPGISTRYLELFERIWLERQRDLGGVLKIRTVQDVVCPTILDVLNARYLVTMKKLDAPDCTLVLWVNADGVILPRYVYRRDNALPRACLVARAVTPAPGPSVLDAICSANPREVCLVEDRPFDGTAAYQELPIERHSFSDITLRFSTADRGVVVISQSWHPDWRATDHGKPIEVRRVNHCLVGIPVAAGAHEIRIWYRPWDLYLGGVVSALTWGLVGSLLLITKQRRKH